MAFEWVAGLFQSEEARGLSGESASSVALDDSNPYYNYRLRRHVAEGDLVSDPGLIWYTLPYVKQREGLGTHIASELGEGVANYTDVLLVLSSEDYARTQANAVEPWITLASRTLQQEFENFCRRENLRRPHSHRPLGFRVLCDGSDEMHQTNLGLGKGEFITGLLPNLYTGPVAGSQPVIGVNVNLPGVWEGYKEVGRLHNDQILFTLGNHWLDNFSHPNLREGALYRLQQYPDGSFVHIVNPDLQDRFQVTSTIQNNASVLTLATREGHPLAYLVLAVMEPTPSHAPSAEKARPGIHMPAPAPKKKKKSDSPSIPSVAPPMLIDDDVQPVLSDTPSLGGKTIIPDAPSERIFTLQERGALFQRVHFSAFMLGYDVYIGARGELGTKVDAPAATLQIRKRTTSLLTHIDGVKIDGASVSSGTEVPLDRHVDIEIEDTKLEFRNLRKGVQIAGWPYVGEIRRPASSTYLFWGEEYRVGRSRECRVVLPDQTRNDNIHWKPKVGDGAYIRTQNDDIPKANFYTDSIMVSSEHATIDLSGDTPRVACNASHCFAFVRRNDEVIALHPTSKVSEQHEVEVEPGDEILVGNCLFQVGFSPTDDAIAPAPAPEVVEFNADSLADAVPEPDFDDPEMTESTVPVEDLVGELPPPEDPASDPAPAEDEGVSDEATVLLDLPQPPTEDEEPAEDAPGDDAPAEVPEAPDDAENASEDVSDDASSDIPSLDNPTIPGLPTPRSTGEAATTFNSEMHDSGRHKQPDLPQVDPQNDAAGWDDEDFGVDTTATPSLRQAMEAPEEAADTGPSTVPTPFPEIDEQDEEPADPASDPSETWEPDPSQSDGDPDPPAADGRTVVYTDDAEAQFELGRPVHLILAGWMLNGEATIGNHAEADLILPENRILATQSFEAQDYLKLKIRGRKSSAQVLASSEVLIDEAEPSEDRYTDLENLTIDVIRRDDAGEEDFCVRLKVTQDKMLPDPRARLVSLDYDDALAAALVTRGLPRSTPRTLTLAGMTLTFTFQDGTLTVSDYLDSYKTEDGFQPFFVQSGNKRFTTAPEDGAAFELGNGDRFVIDQAVYVVREE